MIHYQLRCAAAHEFDGWFKDSANFERQAGRHLIACPVCAGTQVTRALMAPQLGRKSRTPAPDTRPTPAPATPTIPATGGVMPDQVRAALHRLRSEVEKNCDYVGPRFAEEARRIHNGQTAPRGIYGESTRDEVEALAEDGIDIAQIPWLPRADS